MVSLRVLVVGLCFVGLSLPLRADTLNFDDIDASAGDVVLATYRSYTFTNFSAFTTVPGFPGFNNSIVSSPNAAYSSDTGSITSTTPFDFTAAELGSGYYDNLSVTIEGLLGGVLYDSRTITVSTEGAQTFTFDFIGIDTLRLTASTTAATTDPYFCGTVGCSYFTLDDAVLTTDAGPPPPPPPITGVTPEPPAWTLLALGLLAMLLVHRMRVSRP